VHILVIQTDFSKQIFVLLALSYTTEWPFPIRRDSKIQSSSSRVYKESDLEWCVKGLQFLRLRCLPVSRCCQHPESKRSQTSATKTTIYQFQTTTTFAAALQCSISVFTGLHLMKCVYWSSRQTLANISSCCHIQQNEQDKTHKYNSKLQTQCSRHCHLHGMTGTSPALTQTCYSFVNINNVAQLSQKT